jgi:hypothetical protein
VSALALQQKARSAKLLVSVLPRDRDATHLHVPRIEIGVRRHLAACDAHYALPVLAKN